MSIFFAYSIGLNLNSISVDVMMKLKNNFFIFISTLLVLGFSLSAVADQTLALHNKVSTLLSKHALTKTSGNVVGYKTKTRIAYKASSCELRINRILEWHHQRRGTSSTDHGASYMIPLHQIQLDKGDASNRLKLSCQTDDCIAKLLHRKCRSNRRCRRNKTTNSYYLQITPESKQDLAIHIAKLVSYCGAGKTASTATKITY